MADLMEYNLSYSFFNFPLVSADALDGTLVYRDLIRQNISIPGTSFLERIAMIEPQ